MFSLLLSSAAIAKENVLVAEKDALIWSLNQKPDALDAPTEMKDSPATALEALSWQAGEILIEAVKEFGKISRNIICSI